MRIHLLEINVRRRYLPYPLDLLNGIPRTVSPSRRTTIDTGNSSEGSKDRDFDDSSNALWSLYGKEAKSYDEATIQTLKGDMDGVLIFVRS
jgi:hypothetical protein